MGLAFTIDSPVKVARYGIHSVVSIVEDHLVEMMRSHYYPSINEPYLPITIHEEDYRAKRITDYLNLLNRIVIAQVEKLKGAGFEAGSDLVKYFQMLPDNHPVRERYLEMTEETDPARKDSLRAWLRTQVIAGSIDVNIMTKIDKDNYNSRGELLTDGSDAVAALRGYAKSDLTDSSIVFSAGMNPRLYNYLETCKEFDINDDGGFTKKVVIKVSDYRSALIQGKYLAKKGIWVSEFRIESGLNCGGHTFATDGYLLGPILEEFNLKRQELIDTLFEIYNAALQRKRHLQFIYPPKTIFSAQGGIGTHAEDQFLRRHYDLQSTGWGTPFLLVPEATTVDEATLRSLCAAREQDVVLSNSSPLGARFHYLKGTSAEVEKTARINRGRPGSPCTEKHLAFNTEFTTAPICNASRKYQQLKIAQLQSMHLSDKEYNKQYNDVISKECLCVGLSNAAAINYDQTFVKQSRAVTMCPGPNIANFSRISSLQTMTDHIYGRENIMTNPGRPHMFIAELYLYIDYLEEQLEIDYHADQLSKKKKYYSTFYKNLREGITYYQRLPGIMDVNRDQFIKELDDAALELDGLNYRYEIDEQ